MGYRTTRRIAVIDGKGRTVVFSSRTCVKVLGKHRNGEITFRATALVESQRGDDVQQRTARVPLRFLEEIR